MVIRVADQVSYLSPFVAALKMIQEAFSCGCCCCCCFLSKRSTSLLRLLTLICDARFELSSELAFYELHEVS